MTQSQQRERAIEREKQKFKLSQRDECSVNRKKGLTERKGGEMKRQDKEKACVSASVSVIV